MSENTSFYVKLEGSDGEWVNLSKVGEPTLKEEVNPLPFKDQVQDILNDVHTMLLDKNEAYGNSALEPARIFSKADATEQLYVRADDKLSRIKNDQGNDDEDAVLDLIGYLVLIMIARESVEIDE